MSIFSIRASGEFYPSLGGYVAVNAGARVLLAEGDSELRTFFAQGLRRAGYVVLATADGDETLISLSSVARGELPKPDVAVMDVDLAVHSAVELAGAIRRGGWEIPVIFMSTKDEPRVHAAIERLGIIAWLRKPVSPTGIARAVGSALGRSG